MRVDSNDYPASIFDVSLHDSVISWVEFDQSYGPVGLKLLDLGASRLLANPSDPVLQADDLMFGRMRPQSGDPASYIQLIVDKIREIPWLFMSFATLQT